MTAKFTKTTMAVSNKLHGDRTVTAYALNGVAVARLRKSWSVHHAASGNEIYHRLSRPTLTETKAIAEHVAALDVDWERDVDDPRFKEQFESSVNEIREIANMEDLKVS